MSDTTYDLTDPTRPTILKDPDATLDYVWDWTAWLAEIADTISTITITQETGGPTTVSSSHVSGLVTAFISGGTLGATHQVICKIVTAGGRTEERSIYLKMRVR